MSKILDSEAPAPVIEQAKTPSVVEEKPTFVENDAGRAYYEQALTYDVEQLERDAKKVKRKLDFIVLPIMMVTYGLGFLDKQTLNYSNAYTLQKDLGLKGSDYSWIASAVSIGWLISAYPSSLLLQRAPIGRTVGWFIISWGSLCMLSAATNNFGGLFAVRFIQGIAEALITPAWMMLTSMLWTADETPFRTSMWLGVDGLASIIMSAISWGLGGIESTVVPPWKAVFIVVGGVTVIWAVVVLLWLPDGPHNGRLFSEYERCVMVWRVAKNKTGVKNSEFKWYQVREALLDEKTWLLIGTMTLYGILNAGVVNFKSSLIKGFGFTGREANLMQLPSGLFQMAGCAFFGWMARHKNMKNLAIIISCLPGLAGLIAMLTVTHSEQTKYGLVACSWLQSVIGAPVAITYALPVINISGHTKRATVLGLIFAFFAAGMIAGPHLFISTEALRYPTALKGLMICYAIAIVLQIVYASVCFIQNKARDKRYGGAAAPTEEEAARSGFEDLTDKENKHFRWAL